MNKYIQRFNKEHPAYWKKYYQEHRKETIKRQQAYYQLHRKEIIEYATEYGKKYREEHPWMKTLQNIRQRCYYKLDKKYKYYGDKGIECFVTMKDLKYLWFRDKAYLMKQPSIDRINGKKHYSLNNCQFIEMAVNRKKRNKNS